MLLELQESDLLLKFILKSDHMINKQKISLFNKNITYYFFQKYNYFSIQHIQSYILLIITMNFYIFIKMNMLNIQIL